MKDLNWEQRNCKLQFGPEKSSILMQQLDSDIQVKNSGDMLIMLVAQKTDEFGKALDQAEYNGLQFAHWYT
jgi:hypothetical protein